MFVLHRGGIGGGRKGTGTCDFLAWYPRESRGKPVAVEEGTRATTPRMLVGPLNDESLLQGIHALVRDVLAFKQAATCR